MIEVDIMTWNEKNSPLIFDSCFCTVFKSFSKGVEVDIVTWNENELPITITRIY